MRAFMHLFCTHNILPLWLQASPKNVVYTNEMQFATNPLDASHERGHGGPPQWSPCVSEDRPVEWMKRTRRSTGTRQVESKDEDKRDRKRQARVVPAAGKAGAPAHPAALHLCLHEGDQEEPRETGATHLWPSLQAGSSALHEPLLQQGLQQQQEHSDRHDQSQQQQQQQHEQQHRRLDASHPGRVQHVPRRRASLTRRRPGAVSAAEPERPSQPQQEHEHQQRHEPQPLQGAAPPQASMLPSTSTFEHASEPIPPMQIHVKWVSATGKCSSWSVHIYVLEWCTSDACKSLVVCNLPWDHGALQLCPLVGQSS
eukprot:1142543-Pelagomonas_calceolata.AAC.4